MIENKPLNEQQVKELFYKEAILIGTTDRFPVFRAVELLGEKAVKYGARVPGNDVNVYVIDGYDLPYLTYRGFQRAVTYHNINTLCSQRKEAVS